LWDFVKDAGLDVAKGAAHHQYEHFSEKLRHRLLVGSVPANNHLLHAFHRSLAGSALVFAYTLHDPDRKLIHELLKSKANWANFKDFCHQIRESIKGNIIPENAWRGDAWLVRLIEQANEPKNFGDFDLKKVLTDNKTTALVSQQLDEALRDHIQEEFLRWTSAHITVKVPPPPEFASSVRNGLTLRGAHEAKLNFYEIFCLFFREELQAQTQVHQAYVIDVLAELKGDVDRIVAALPTPEERVAFQRAVDSLGRFNEFKAALERQNKEHFDKIATALTRLERKLDYAIAGLPIQRFELPDPPTRELELLHAKHRAVDLVGRVTDLASLWQWLRDGENISARLLVGRAGTGKTRLALELLLRVNEEMPEWQAGLIPGDALRKFDATKQAYDWTWPAPTLLVVDYAQTLAKPLTEVLKALTHKRHTQGLPALRILLLERQPGDWFDALLRAEDSAGPCSVEKLFHPPTPVQLTPLPEGQIRRQILEQTLTKAAQFSSKPPVVLPAEGHPDYDASLKREIFEQPLNLMLAALAASELGLLPALTRSRIEPAEVLAKRARHWRPRRVSPQTRIELAEVLAKRELDRVERFARDPQNEAQKRLLRHLTACATMERGFTAEELEPAVKEESNAIDRTWPDGAGDLAEVLRQALPGGHLPVAPVEPDFVGEALVLEALWLDRRIGSDRLRSWCEVVSRCFRRDPLDTPATLLHAFQNFGHQPKYGEALLAATDTLIRMSLAGQDPAFLLGIESAMPHQTVELRSRAAEVTRHLYTRLKAELIKGREELKPEVARLANNLSIRLSEMGRRADALAPAQEAVDLGRVLAQRNPDAFQPDLAMSLNNLANRLSGMGRRAEALAPAQEAVELRRALAQRNPDAFQPALAMSLNNLAAFLCEMGRHADALAPAQEAVELYRALAQRNPDAFQPDLGKSLINLATFLSEMGRRADALAPAQEAVELYRALAQRNPDAFQPALAASLGTFGQILEGN
jgi:tetratricopeptide (TPR) repeat protein